MALKLDSAGITAEYSQRYDWRDVALYALSLGAGTDDLPFVVDDPPPRVLPTYGVLSAFAPVFDVMRKAGGDLTQVLHTYQYTELLTPFPCAGELHTTAVLRGLWDMKIGAMALIDTETRVDDELCSRTTWELLLRGQGGFRGERPPRNPRTRVPADAEPLFEIDVPTSRNQALLYRLNGDINPLHSNPEFAKMAGFDRPILHGLCGYGIAARVALGQLAGNDPARFLSFSARFNKVVMPGDTLTVRGYALQTDAEHSAAAVTLTVKESGELAIASARIEYV